MLRRRRLIQKYNRAELLVEDGDRAYTVIEKAIFYSAFIIRKLIDCKGKVSDDVDEYIFHLKGVRPIKEINLLHRWPEDDSHNWEHEETHTKSGADICNWLIHSYVFFLSYDENGAINGFYVSSDYDRNKMLYRIELKDWLAYMDFVGKDYIVSTCMHVDKNKKDYVYTRKERGGLQQKYILPIETRHR